MSAQELLACTLTYRASPTRHTSIPLKFNNKEEAISTFFEVLMHEAHESMSTPLDHSPQRPYLHPVDIDTSEPGIIDSREGSHVMRCTPNMRVRYDHFKTRMLRALRSDVDTDLSKVADAKNERGSMHSVSDSMESALTHADNIDMSSSSRSGKVRRGRVLNEDDALAREEKKAATAMAREARVKQRREERANETCEERAARLLEAKCKRQERKARAAEKGDPACIHAEASSTVSNSQLEDGNLTSADASVGPGVHDEKDDEFVVVHDTSIQSELASLRKRRKRSDVHFFAHPLPHHRHLLALQLCDPCTEILDALLVGKATDAVEVIQGPPGTGKTRALVDRLRCAHGRVFLCAPTNVGVVNLYKRALESDFVDAAEVSIVLPPERIPQGTTVHSNDPRRRVVCSTISSRSGPILLSHNFANVFVDEAAMCQEAWMWTLLRRDVRRLVLAGDTMQLPAIASASGVALRHERSLMERLVQLKYANIVTMTIQNRMAPQILEFPNREFYDDLLQCGPFAPSLGRVEVVEVVDGVEEVVHSSYRNVREAEEAVRLACEIASASQNEPCGIQTAATTEVVILTPYAAQALVLLSLASGRQVHTLDSFQGREATVVVLSVVRDGSSGLGFLYDNRRLAVALTRARERMILVVSKVRQWPPCLLRTYVEEHV